METIKLEPQKIEVKQAYLTSSSITEKFINVQPLTGPTGLIYYLRYRYGKNKENNKERF